MFKKKISCLFFYLIVAILIIYKITYNIYAEEIHIYTNINTSINSDADTSNIKKIIKFQEVQVFSNRETNERDKIPTSSTNINTLDIESLQINSIKNISVTVPNLFIPDYGSKMSSSVYIRGIGSRSSGQSVGFYVDNVPYLNKSNFDFNFFDIQQIEVLRGSQSTLYGRNSMSGIINIYSLSPFSFQGTKLEVGAGNYGLFNTRISHYNIISDKVGFSVGAYVERGDGFFINSYNNKSADDFLTAGSRVKFDWNLSNNLFLQYIINFERTSQTAFPYGYYNDTTKTLSEVTINDESSYKQNSFTLSQNLEFKFSKVNITSTTSYQYLDDNMKLDQDFTSEPIFILQQIQRRNAITEEIILRPMNNLTNNYQWNIGLFAFYDMINTSAPVLFKTLGVDRLIEKKVTSNLPPYVSYKILEDEMPIVDELETPTFGAAIFHQSTLTNILLNGLDITAGIRFDYEKAKIIYNNSTALTQFYSITFGNMTIEDAMKASIDLKGSETKNYLQVLPKLAVSYVFSGEKDENKISNKIFASISRGYKSGGFNLQMLSDITQNNLRSEMMQEIRTSIYNKLTEIGMPADAVENNIISNMPQINKINNIGEFISYEPEYSWDYEIGGNFNLFNNKLFLDISLFFMNIKNMQITQFSPNGFGRMLSNAGAVKTKGAEMSLTFDIFTNRTNTLSACINYGYAHAIFTNYKDSIKINNIYKEVDYSGNYVPYAPQHTISISTNYVYIINNKIFNNVSIGLQIIDAGKIYWNESNNIFQEHYQLINSKITIGFIKDIFLEFWVKNISNTSYKTFYFETLGNKFFQLGKPKQFGAALKINF